MHVRTAICRLPATCATCSLKKLESQLRSREQLAEGLHLIDFEQLKIENQSLSEKIDERNEELVKLRRKNTNMVQARALVLSSAVEGRGRPRPQQGNGGRRYTQQRS
jgi:hypothetical protein